MNRFTVSATTLLVTLGLAIGSADARVRTITDPQAPRALEGDSPVQVDWTDPAQFSDLRYSRNRWEAQRGNWVNQLAEYFQDATARQLPEGERLQLTITDIKRAGEYEPWRGARSQDIRIVRDIYPPRLSFRYTRTAADGTVIDQGEEKLVDMGFMMGPTPMNSSDPLRYEKRMIDDWVRSEFRGDRASASR